MLPNHVADKSLFILRELGKPLTVKAESNEGDFPSCRPSQLPARPNERNLYSTKLCHQLVNRRLGEGVGKMHTRVTMGTDKL